MKYVGLIIAIFVAGLAAYMVLSLSGGDEAPAPVVRRAPSASQPVQIAPQAAPQVETANVYVAAKPIPIGSVVEENMLTVQPWPKHLLIDGFVVGAEEGKKIIGTVTRAPFQAMEPMIKTKLVNPEDPNFLAGALPSGMRVITLATDEIAGVAGFIFPGDHVDVLIYHRILKEGITQKEIDEAKSENEVTEEVSEALIVNAKVVAVDQRATAGATQDSGNNEGGIIIPKSVSLEVSPEDAQRIVLARETGELNLALRSIEDKDLIEKVAITRKPALSQFDISSIAPKKENDEIPVKIIRGTAIEVLAPAGEELR